MELGNLGDEAPPRGAPAAETSNEPITERQLQADGFANNMFNLVSSLSNPQASSPMPTLTWTQPISVEQTNARFVEQHQPNYPRKRAGGGRPRLPEERLKRPRVDPRAKPTKLSGRKPVHVDVPADVWTLIFHFTEYQTLMSLRLTCREFCYTTSREGFWRRYLEEHLSGLERPCPEIPPQLSHMQYADLLLGKGCMGCGASKTKRVQWAFFRRWCKACFSEKTITAHEAQSITQQHGPLLNCIPAADIDMWKNYSKVALSGTESSAPANNRRSTDLKYFAVAKRDLTRIVNEQEAYKASLPSDLDDAQKETQLKTWKEERTEAAQKDLARAKACQDFAKAWQQYLDDLDEARGEALKQVRANFFELKASELDPPLEKEALQNIPGYAKSLEVRRAPTERSWREILQKIKQYRGEAEGSHRSGRNRSLDEIQSEMESEANSRARCLLLQIADVVLGEFDDSDVAPEDFIYLSLREIRDRYYSLPLDRVPSLGEQDLDRLNEESRHQLNIDDARFVYDKKIEKHIEGWSNAVEKRKGSFIYCPGCTRTDYRRKFGFNQLLDHISYAHCSQLSSPWRLYAQTDMTWGSGSFPYWRSVPWPRNLPILAPHQKATGQWDPDETHYERAPRKIVHNNSAFEGRIVRPRTPEADNVAQHVVGAILEAAEKLRDSPLATPYKALITWEYGMQSAAQFPHAPRLTTTDLDQISAALIRAGEFSIFSKVGCQSCVDPKLLKPHKYAEIKHSFETIINHWKSEHRKPRNPASVETELLHLPSGAELDVELAKDGLGMAATRDTFDYLFPLVSSNEAVFSLTLALANEDETAENDVPSQSSTKGKRKPPVDALNVLAEQAAKIDPRLRDWGAQNRTQNLDKAGSQDDEDEETSDRPESSSSGSRNPLTSMLMKMNSWKTGPRESSERNIPADDSR